MRQKRQKCDVVVAGAGVAGLSAALAAAEAGASVLVLAKASHRSSNSYAAQGGVAAAVGPDDDPQLHAADTLTAGRGLCRPSAVRLLTEEAPAPGSASCAGSESRSTTDSAARAATPTPASCMQAAPTPGATSPTF